MECDLRKIFFSMCVQMGVGVCAYVEGSAWHGWACTCIKGREREERVFFWVVWSGRECVHVYVGLWACVCTWVQACTYISWFFFFVSGMLYRVLRKTGKQIVEPTLVKLWWWKVHKNWLDTSEFDQKSHRLSRLSLDKVLAEFVADKEFWIMIDDDNDDDTWEYNKWSDGGCTSFKQKELSLKTPSRFSGWLLFGPNVTPEMISKIFKKIIIKNWKNWYMPRLGYGCLHRYYVCWY